MCRGLLQNRDTTLMKKRPKTIIPTSKADTDTVFEALLKYGSVRINNICVLELRKTKNAKHIKNLGKDFIRPKGSLRIAVKASLYLKNKLKEYEARRTK